MAEDIRVTERSAGDRPGGAPEELADPVAARSEIEMTRARMSETIDEIEGALLRKKQRIRERMDVTAPVRDNPIPSAAAALGAGLVLGFMTGGGGDEHEPSARDRHRRHRFDGEARDERLRAAEERAETWEARARRLMRVAREQESELETLAELPDWETEGDDPGEVLRSLRDRITDGVSGFVGSVVREVFAGGRR